MRLGTEQQPATSPTHTSLCPVPSALCPVQSSRLAPWLLTPVVLLVHGYHPLAGDAGIYTAGIRHILNPGLYPLNAVFVDAFTRLSIFAWTVAALVRLTHLSLEWILLPLHLLSISLFLGANRSLAARLFAAESARWCAVALAAACCALPVAGTALVLMDPYATARSFSTPISLFAISACLEGRWLRTVLLLSFAAVLHPLMGCFAMAFVLLLALIRTNHLRRALLTCAAAIVIAGAAFALAHRVPASTAYREVIDLPQRSFLFLARWQWYEILGLIFPLALFAVAWRRFPRSTAVGALCLTCILVGNTSIVIAALFVPPAGPWLLVPLQVLRAFQLIYAAGVILSAGALTRFQLPAIALLVALFAGMSFAERSTWPECDRIEWPGAQPSDPYEQAFDWIRMRTPHNAVFAFDPQFVYWPGEDEQGFRALTERDQLADDKDAGIVAVLPGLAQRWATQRNAVGGINTMSDDQRRSALSAFGATWLLLPPASPTALRCLYRNRAVQVCQVTR